jgi:hypothetical protein
MVPLKGITSPAKVTFQQKVCFREKMFLFSTFDVESLIQQTFISVLKSYKMHALFLFL